MLKSWESDGNQVLPATQREHHTLKGVVRRMRRLQAAGKFGHGEMPDGRYLISVEPYPNCYEAAADRRRRNAYAWHLR